MLRMGRCAFGLVALLSGAAKLCRLNYDKTTNTMHKCIYGSGDDAAECRVVRHRSNYWVIFKYARQQRCVHKATDFTIVQQRQQRSAASSTALEHRAHRFRTGDWVLISARRATTSSATTRSVLRRGVKTRRRDICCAARAPADRY